MRAKIADVVPVQAEECATLVEPTEIDPVPKALCHTLGSGHRSAHKFTAIDTSARFGNGPNGRNFEVTAPIQATKR
jgi:hypothetical protein